MVWQHHEKGTVVPGWSVDVLDPRRALIAKTSSSHLKSEIPDTHGGIRLTHVGHEMLAYWHGVRGGKVMPDCSDISPAGFRSLLPYSRYLSWEGPEDLRIRVFGSALCTVLGTDMTGDNMLETLLPDQREKETAYLRAMHEHPCGLIFVRHSFIVGGGSREIEVLHLPIGPEGPEASEPGKSRILGSIMVREVPEHWDGETDRDQPLERIDMACIDIGFGTPDWVVGD